MKAWNDPFPRLVPSLFLPLYFYHWQQRRITSTGARTADVVTKNEPNRWEGHQNLSRSLFGPSFATNLGRRTGHNMKCKYRRCVLILKKAACLEGIHRNQQKPANKTPKQQQNTKNQNTIKINLSSKSETARKVRGQSSFSFPNAHSAGPPLTDEVPGDRLRRPLW